MASIINASYRPSCVAIRYSIENVKRKGGIERERETCTHTQTHTQQEGEPGGKKTFPMRSPSNNKKHFLLLWLTCHASAPNMTKASKYKIYIQDIRSESLQL